MQRVLPLACAFAATLAGSSPGWSQSRAVDSVSPAIALFREGQRLMREGRIAEACPKFAASQRLDPGTGTLLNLGDCYERLGKTGSAWGAFNEAMFLSRRRGDEARAEEAARRAKLLEPKLAKMTIVVAPPNRAPGLEVRLDGQVVGDGAWGTAVPVDPGEHAIEAGAPGRKGWSGKLTVVAAGTVIAEVPMLVEAPADAAATTERRVFWSGQRIAGATVGGVGLLGVVVGAVFGVQTLSKTSDAKGHCSGATPDICDPTGIKLQGEAKTTARVADVAFAVGGAALIGGVVLFATAPSSSAKKSGAAPVTIGAAFGFGTGEMQLRGEW